MAQVPDIQKYSTVPMRTTVYAAKDMLKFAENQSIMAKFGLTKPMPRNKGETQVFRRLNPFNMQANGAPGEIDPGQLILAEGVNPPTYSINYTDVPLTLQQYGLAFKFSSKTQLLYEDNVVADMKRLVGNAMADMKEMILYGALRGGTVVDYSNGVTRAAVNKPISIEQIQRASRTLWDARAHMVTTRVDASPKYGTSPIEPGWLVFGHTDAAADIRRLPGFVKAVEYASGAKLHPYEIGAVDDFRFILSPMYSPFVGAGSGTLNGMKSRGGTNVDVYPFIVIGEEAYGHMPLKGLESFRPVIHPAEPSKADLFGQWGVVGGVTWEAAGRLNENWMVRLEAGVSSLLA